jgi:hypothetical protein
MAQPVIEEKKTVCCFCSKSAAKGAVAVRPGLAARGLSPDLKTAGTIPSLLFALFYQVEIRHRQLPQQQSAPLAGRPTPLTLQSDYGNSVVARFVGRSRTEAGKCGPQMLDHKAAQKIR